MFHHTIFADYSRWFAAEWKAGEGDTLNVIIHRQQFSKIHPGLLIRTRLHLEVVIHGNHV